MLNTLDDEEEKAIFEALKKNRNAFNIFKAMLKEDDLRIKTRIEAASGMSQFLLNNSEVLDLTEYNDMFQLIGGSTSLRQNLSEILSKNKDLFALFIKDADKAAAVLAQPKAVKVQDLNVILFALTLSNVPGQTKINFIKQFYNFLSESPNRANRTLYSLSLLSAIEQLNVTEQGLLNKKFPNIWASLKPLVYAESPPYKEIFGPKNPNKDLNIRAYVPLEPETFRNMFANDLGLQKK